ncbi:MAG: cyclic nucleotide-binding domain-containing protein [Actinobacteria bacterium]|nr:cyclic nucleotide-binding domain-containing protein [Actinomycetota bacterium]
MSMTEREKADLLGSVPLFASCTRAELNHVAQMSEAVHFDDGQTLVEEGEDGGGFYVIVDGSAAVAHAGEEVAELGQGEVLGELALLLQAPRTATVTATEEVRALRIDPRRFRSMLLEHPKVAVKLLEVLAGRLRLVEGRDRDQ